MMHSIEYQYYCTLHLSWRLHSFGEPHLMSLQHGTACPPLSQDSK